MDVLTVEWVATQLCIVNASYLILLLEQLVNIWLNLLNVVLPCIPLLHLFNLLKLLVQLSLQIIVFVFPESIIWHYWKTITSALLLFVLVLFFDIILHQTFLRFKALLFLLYTLKFIFGILVQGILIVQIIVKLRILLLIWLELNIVLILT